VTSANRPRHSSRLAEHPDAEEGYQLILTEENNSYGWDKLPEIIADSNNIRIPGAGAKFEKIQIGAGQLDLLFTGERLPRQPSKRLPAGGRTRSRAD
jgi:hypothetical protein